ncbi:DUF1391 family protein, partial [Escherichia coli]
MLNLGNNESLVCGVF